MARSPTTKARLIPPYPVQETVFTTEVMAIAARCRKHLQCAKMVGTARHR